MRQSNRFAPCAEVIVPGALPTNRVLSIQGRMRLAHCWLLMLSVSESRILECNEMKGMLVGWD